MANRLTIAVAGSGKTRSIVERCAALPRDRRALVVTYTQTNQAELRIRLAHEAGDHCGIVVMGWFTFLLRDFARPFLPFLFPGKRVRGFNFEGRPHRMATGARRFLDSTEAVYGCELSRLSHELVEASHGALLHRLECMYDEILIDEVQDLSSVSVRPSHVSPVAAAARSSPCSRANEEGVGDGERNGRSAGCGAAVLAGT